jgi:hypothetical protein
MCGRKYSMLVAKEEPLYGGCNRKIIKYELFDNSMSHKKTTTHGKGVSDI